MNFSVNGGVWYPNKIPTPIRIVQVSFVLDGAIGGGGTLYTGNFTSFKIETLVVIEVSQLIQSRFRTFPRFDIFG